MGSGGFELGCKEGAHCSSELSSKSDFCAISVFTLVVLDGFSGFTVKLCSKW